ncbi:MAG TPA: type IV pilin, partial [Methanoregula sp.]|nr:type IV pilin [Methanoregula sp.]
MLIVVIIIAAVVSGFAGSLMNGKQKVPTLAMDFDIANSGHWSNSYFKGEVTSTSAPINTHDLKIVTSWTKNFINGTVYRGGATTSPGVVNTNIIYDTHGGAGYDLWRLTVPYGYGAGVGNGTPLGGNIFWTIDNGGG